MPNYKGTYTTIARVKLIIVLRTFVLPVVVAVAVFFFISTDNLFFNVIMGVALFLACLIRFFVSKRRYLTNLHLSDSQLAVQSLSPFLKLDTCKLRLIHVTAIQTVNRNFLFNAPELVAIKYKNEWLEYAFVNKKSKGELQPLIDEATRIIVVMHHHKSK